MRVSACAEAMTGSARRQKIKKREINLFKISITLRLSTCMSAGLFERIITLLFFNRLVRIPAG